MSSRVKPEQIDTELVPDIQKLPANPKAGAIFGKDGMSSKQVAHEKSVGNVRTNIKTLTELQNMNPTTERTEEIVKLERQRGRIGRFAYLQNRGTPEQKKLLEKKDTMESLKASDLLLLKKKGADLANLLLVADTNPTGSVVRDSIKEGDKFIVNFGESKHINNVIGAGDILPASVSHITINGVEGVRKNAPRPGFYDAKGKYLPIYDGYKVEVMKMGKMEEKEMKELSESEDRWFRERRIEDMVDNGGKALSELPEDMELEKVAQEEVKQRKSIRESIGTMREGKFFGTTTKPISETVKALKDLNMEETTKLLKKIFGEGPGTDLLISLDGGSAVAIKRMITLAYHEGGLVFGRQNPDPKSGFNIGTFQIGGSNSTREVSMDKYESCLQSGIRLAWQKGVVVDYEKLKKDPAQRDLLTHLWYIQAQRKGADTFERLRDADLSDSEVVYLMHHDIQWGIPAIWHSVVAQMNTRIDLEKIQAA